MNQQNDLPILVGVDGSQASLAALRWALRHGAKEEQTVKVVHCYYMHSLRDLAFATNEQLRRGSECMLDNEVAQGLRDLSNPPHVIKSSVQGRPGSVLAYLARDASVVVIGAANSHRRPHGKLAKTLANRIPNTLIRVDSQGAEVNQALST